MKCECRIEWVDSSDTSLRERPVIRKCAYCVEKEAAAQAAVKFLYATRESHHAYEDDDEATRIVARCRAAGWEVE